MIPSDGSTPQSFFNSDVSLFIYYKVVATFSTFSFD